MTLSDSRRPAVRDDVEAATLARDGSPPVTRTHPSDMPCPLPRWTGTGASVGCFPVPLRPSPLFRRVGVHDFTFEACSGFTRVTARRIAQPPKAAFVTRLRPARLPDQTARQLPESNRQLSGWILPPLVNRAVWGARRVEDGRGGLGHGIAPFPVPAHRTQRADFPHYALRLASSRSCRRRANVHPA